jgi:hypothetical protein
MAKAKVASKPEDPREGFTLDQRHPLSGHLARDPIHITVCAMTILEDVESVLRAIKRLAANDADIVTLIDKTIGRIQMEHGDLDCDHECFEDAERAAQKGAVA